MPYPKNISTPELFHTWARQYRANPVNTRTSLTAGDYDPSGNIFAVGYSNSNFEGRATLGGRDIFVMKFSADGTRTWVRFFGTTADEEPADCAADFAGNVVVVGWTSGGLNGRTNAGGSDAYLMKLDASGTILNTTLWGTAQEDVATGVVTDSNGNIFVVGYTQAAIATRRSTSSCCDYDVVVSRFTSNGAVVWHQQFGSNSNDLPTYSRSWTDGFGYRSDLQGKSIAVGSSGEIYITYSTPGSIGTPSPAGGVDCYVLRLTSTGATTWTTGLQSSQDDWCSGLVLDNGGDVYVNGYTRGNLNGQYYAGNDDIFVARISTAGQTVWTRIYGHYGNQRPESLTLDSNGGLYLTGWTDSPVFDGQPDISYLDSGSAYGAAFITKYDLQGNRIWTRFFNSVRSYRWYTYQAAAAYPNHIMSNAAGDLVVMGGYSGVMYEVENSATPSNDLFYTQAFIFQAKQQTNCSVGEFDSLMTEINDLLNSMQYYAY